MKKKEFILSADDAGRRLDRVIRIFCKEESLSRLYGAMRKGLIRVNGKKVVAGYKMIQGDLLSIPAMLIPCADTMAQKDDVVESYKEGVTVLDQIGRIPVLLHTPDLLIVNKPAGMPVHGENSVSTVLCEQTELIQRKKGLSFRMGPLHRLDKYTSGIVCFSQSLAGAQWFSHCLHEKIVQKYYIGIVEGKMSSRSIQTREGAADLITYCCVLDYNVQTNLSCVLFQLITGKKHQIRKHAQHCGHPLAGDQRYGSKMLLKGCNYYVLHAWRLYFPKQRIIGLPDSVEAPLSAKIENILAAFFPRWYSRAIEKIS